MLGCFQGLDFHCDSTVHASIDNGDIRMAKQNPLIQDVPKWQGARNLFGWHAGIKYFT